MLVTYFSFFFFFNDTATTEIYTLSLHDALPISGESYDAIPSDSARFCSVLCTAGCHAGAGARGQAIVKVVRCRSEEHTSELQSLAYLVCRLLLEKKKKKQTQSTSICASNILYYH